MNDRNESQNKCTQWEKNLAEMNLAIIRELFFEEETGNDTPCPDRAYRCLPIICVNLRPSADKSLFSFAP
jgi:hypothetical protein